MIEQNAVSDFERRFALFVGSRPKTAFLEKVPFFDENTPQIMP